MRQRTGIPVGDLFTVMEAWQDDGRIKAAMDVILEIEAGARLGIVGLRSCVGSVAAPPPFPGTASGWLLISSCTTWTAAARVGRTRRCAAAAAPGCAAARRRAGPCRAAVPTARHTAPLALARAVPSPRRRLGQGEHQGGAGRADGADEVVGHQGGAGHAQHHRSGGGLLPGGAAVAGRV
jgi:hypothetical protein